MNGFNWRRILMVAGALGGLAGIIPMFLNLQWLFSTLPVATMFAVYFLVPRLESRRFVSALISSVLTAVIAMVLYFAFAYATLPSAQATTDLMNAVKQVLLTVLFVSLAGSFIFVKTHEWTEKKRLQMEAKAAAARAEKAKDAPREKRHYKIRSKRKYKKK